MQQEEVVAEETGADVAEIGKGDSPPDFAGGGVDVVYAPIFQKQKKKEEETELSVLYQIYNLHSE